MFTLGQKSAAGQLALAFPLLLACMLAVALLGPLLVALTAWLARPAVAVGGAPARLALAAIAAQPRRAASAVIPVAMAVAMVGTSLLRRHLDPARHRRPGGEHGDGRQRTFRA